MNVESLYRPSAFRQIHVMPRMQMAWFWGDEVQAKWDLWPLVPALAPTWPPRPKPDLLTGRWVENLPAEEVERLKQIFREHGRLADPNRVDLREAIGSTARLRTSPFVAGTYALCLRKQDEKGRMLPQWTSYAIGANGEGRLLLEKWVAAHYEALKCAAIEPAQAVIPDKYFSWSDGEWHVCIPLLRWFPVAPPGSAAYSQAVKSMDKREIEELELIFRKHGKMQDLGPDCAQGVSWPGW
jgi:hypothetical protein